jgi:hypothetical protein
MTSVRQIHSICFLAGGICAWKEGKEMIVQVTLLLFARLSITTYYVTPHFKQEINMNE